MRSLEIQETLQKEARERHANTSKILQPLLVTGLLTIDCCRWPVFCDPCEMMMTISTWDSAPSCCF